MKRSPMSRGSGFKRPVLERVRTVHKPIPLELRRGVISPAASTPADPLAKFVYVRSRKLLNAIKTLECQHCGCAGPSDPAHSNQSCHGKGGRIKASDVYVAALCRADHDELDQGSRLTQEERVTLWTNAWRRTVRELLRRGLWPIEIPIPDIRSFN